MKRTLVLGAPAVAMPIEIVGLSKSWRWLRRRPSPVAALTRGPLAVDTYFQKAFAVGDATHGRERRQPSGVA